VDLLLSHQLWDGGRNSSCDPLGQKVGFATRNRLYGLNRAVLRWYNSVGTLQPAKGGCPISFGAGYSGPQPTHPDSLNLVVWQPGCTYRAVSQELIVPET